MITLYAVLCIDKTMGFKFPRLQQGFMFRERKEAERLLKKYKGKEERYVFKIETVED